MQPVKQMLWSFGRACAFVVVATACPTETPAEEAPACLLVRRPVDPVLVILHPAGREDRRPLLRPSCAAVVDASLVWADTAGLHVEFSGGTNLDVAAGPSVIGKGCLAGAVSNRHRALVQRPSGPVIVDDMGERAAVLPALRPNERVTGILRDGSLLVGDGCRTRVIGLAGGPASEIFGPRGTTLGRVEPGALVLLDGRRVPFPGGTPDLVYGRTDSFVLAFGEERTLVVGGRVVPLEKKQPVWVDDARMLVTTAEGDLRAITATGEEPYFALPRDVDLTGQPLHRRVRSHYSFDATTKELLVIERIADAHCNSSDNIVVVDAAGAIRVIASGPKTRVDAAMEEGIISYVEYDLAYEALGGDSDDKGTKVP
ncbi:MAG: hypothetical protein Q8O67_04585 [Deltaproteobacteria bacterium]|nr:hypothetical protein [Deltaproteobacteria bacterium]